MLLLLACTAPRGSGPMSQDAYVWQRVWTPEVVEAVDGSTFDSLALLGAERTWGQPTFFVDLGTLPEGTSLVLRAGAPPSGFDPVPDLLGDLRALVTAHPEVSSLELDMDLPSARLPEYAGWLARLQEGLEVPLGVTALPTWIDQPGFTELAARTQGLTLQLHWLDPNDPGHLTSPDAAVHVQRMGELEQAFRVALPTYGYQLHLDEGGGLVGVVAEQDLPAGARTRELMADPTRIAPLIAGWTRDRPASMEGVIWFRLPTAQDRRVWPARTLQAVAQGRVPQARAELELQQEGELWTLVLHNRGEASLALPTLELDQPVPLADGLGAYAWVPPDQLQPHLESSPLPPDTQLTVGWLRSPSPPRVLLHDAPP